MLDDPAPRTKREEYDVSLFDCELHAVVERGQLVEVWCGSEINVLPVLTAAQVEQVYDEIREQDEGSD